MKKLIVALLFASFALSGAFASEYEDGHAALKNHDIVSAAEHFKAAVKKTPADKNAQAMCALTRVLALVQSEAFYNMMGNTVLRVENLDLYSGDCLSAFDLKKRPDGTADFPEEWNTAENMDYLESVCLPELTEALKNIDKANDKKLAVSLVGAEIEFLGMNLDAGGGYVMDYADLLVVKAAVKSIVAAIRSAQNFNVSAYPYLYGKLNRDCTLQILTAAYPQLGRATKAGRAAAAKTAFTDAITAYEAASAAVRARTSQNGLFAWDESLADEESELRANLAKAKTSAGGKAAAFELGGKKLDVNLSKFFAEGFDIRKYEPYISGNTIVRGSFPDYTFGGVLPNFTAQNFDEFFPDDTLEKPEMRGIGIMSRPETLDIGLGFPAAASEGGEAVAEFSACNGTVAYKSAEADKLLYYKSSTAYNSYKVLSPSGAALSDCSFGIGSKNKISEFRYMVFLSGDATLYGKTKLNTSRQMGNRSVYKRAGEWDTIYLSNVFSDNSDKNFRAIEFSFISEYEVYNFTVEAKYTDGYSEYFFAKPAVVKNGDKYYVSFECPMWSPADKSAPLKGVLLSLEADCKDSSFTLYDVVCTQKFDKKLLYYRGIGRAEICVDSSTQTEIIATNAAINRNFSKIAYSTDDGENINIYTMTSFPRGQSKLVKSFAKVYGSSEVAPRLFFDESTLCYAFNGIVGMERGTSTVESKYDGELFDVKGGLALTSRGLYRISDGKCTVSCPYNIRPLCFLNDTSSLILAYLRDSSTDSMSLAVLQGLSDKRVRKVLLKDIPWWAQYEEDYVVCDDYRKNRIYMLADPQPYGIAYHRDGVNALMVFNEYGKAVVCHPAQSRLKVGSSYAPLSFAASGGSWKTVATPLTGKLGKLPSSPNLLKNSMVYNLKVRDFNAPSGMVSLPTVVGQDSKAGELYEVAFYNQSDTGVAYMANSAIVLLGGTLPNPLIKITKQPKFGEIYDSQELVSLEVEAQGEELIYQWYSSTDGKTWEEVSGAVSSKLETTTPANGTQYKCVITNAANKKGVSSATAKATVKAAIKISEQPADATIVSGGNAKFAVKATGTAPIKYQWEYFKDNSYWTSVEKGGTSATLAVSKADKSFDSRKYRCVVSNGGGSVCSGAATLFVNQKTEVESPKDTTFYVFENGMRAVELTARAEESVLAQWQIKLPKAKDWTPLGDFENCGESPATLLCAVEGATLADGTKYRCAVKSSRGNEAPVYSKELTAKRSVYTDVVPSEYSETNYVWAFDGSDKSIKDADAKAVFSVSAKGTGALKYQWFVEEDGEASPIAKAVSPKYTTPRLSESGGDFDKLYFCVVSSPAGEVSSGKFGIRRSSAVSDSDIFPIADVKCADTDTAVFTVETSFGAAGGLSYLWQVCAAGANPDDEKNWKNAGSSKSELVIRKPAAALGGNLYRCKVWNAGNAKGKEAVSNIATLSVMAAAKISKANFATATIEGVPTVFSVAASGYNAKYVWTLTDSRGMVILTEITEVPEVEICVPSGKGYQLSCSVQSYSDGGEALGKPAIKTAKINSIAALSAEGISIKRTAGETEIFDSDIDTRVAVGFPLALGAEVSGDAPVYQWYEIENGGEPVALKTGKAKTLKIGMKAVDWAGVVSKTYYCEAYNKSGKVVSKTVRTPSITLWLDEAPMPASLAGMAFDAESDGIKFRAFFADSKKVYLAAEYDAVDYCNSTYTFKRLSETSAQLKITYTRGDGDGGSRNYSETGLLEADWDSGDISVFLADQSGELLVYSAQPLTGIEAPDSMPLGTVRYDASTTATFLAGGTCFLSMNGYTVPAKYTYKKTAVDGSMAMLNVDLKNQYGEKCTAELPLFFVKTGFADYIAYLKRGKLFETQTGTLAFPKK